MSTIPLSLVKEAIQSYCAKASGLPGNKCIFAYQKGGEPQGSFVLVTPISSGLRSGMFDESIMHANGDLEYVHRRSVTAQLDCYGQDAESIAFKLFDGIDIPFFHAVFSDQSMTAKFVSTIRDLSAIENIRFEKRMSMDLKVDVAYSTLIAVDLAGREPDEDPSAGSGLIFADDVGWFDSIKVKDNILGTPEIIITGD
jgi:hypothetical protein